MNDLYIIIKITMCDIKFIFTGDDKCNNKCISDIRYLIDNMFIKYIPKIVKYEDYIDNPSPISVLSVKIEIFKTLKHLEKFINIETLQISGHKSSDNSSDKIPNETLNKLKKLKNVIFEDMVIDNDISYENIELNHCSIKYIDFYPKPDNIKRLQIKDCEGYINITNLKNLEELVLLNYMPEMEKMILSKDTFYTEHIKAYFPKLKNITYVNNNHFNYEYDMKKMIHKSPNLKTFKIDNDWLKYYYFMCVCELLTIQSDDMTDIVDQQFKKNSNKFIELKIYNSHNLINDKYDIIFNSRYFDIRINELNKEFYIYIH